MGVIHLLLIACSLTGGMLSNSEKPSCAIQIESIKVEEGSNVTIPCNIIYPWEDWDSTTEIKVHWRSGQNSPCGSNKIIYKYPENWTHQKYAGRISMVGNPREQKTASIRIQGVSRMDGPLYCCRVELIDRNTGSQGWQNHHGTSLKFTDQIWVDQLDVIPTLPGETVTIPCPIHYPSGKTVTVQKVTWKMGASEVCSEKQTQFTWDKSDKQRQFSLVNFPDDVSLIIKNVSSKDSRRYCCEVTVDGSLYGSVRGTELVLGASTSTKFTVVQPPETTANLGSSTTLSCSYTYSTEKEKASAEIYWRVGNPTGDYAYHPSQEMIHSTYRGRTELRGQADLHIQDVQRTDTTSYYCQVIIRNCIGKVKVKTSVVHGQGTRLSVKDKPSCAMQIGSIPVEERSNVIIPCSIIYPWGDWENSTEIKVHWRSGENSSCGSNKLIYKYPENWTHQSYKGRISMVGNPKELKTASIRIEGLRRTDGPTYCCRVELMDRNTGWQGWQNHHGTSLQFPDQIWVNQLDVIPVLPGETVTIPCPIDYPNGKRFSLQKVTWKMGASEVCSEKQTIFTWDNSNKQGRFSLVNFPDDVSLIIKNVSSKDIRRYCCEVTVDGSQYGSVSGTELVLGASFSEKVTVFQHIEITANLGGSITLSCTYRFPTEEEPALTEIYWRVGSPTGHYAYHPSKEMICSKYRGRTELRGKADLHIQDVQSTDTISYYCLVMIRECVGKAKVKPSIVHGQGTRLIVKGGVTSSG
ncbi:sialic acid-binding Ig-like lectin 14 [Pelobates cultripes]|uniref:Sialic acid-binding Ig-like lectin 14 n=1 Tax=Pelobates cultripes TaxID=61616 RepID=A0AAD1RJI6_PELCU|nr:sialic acid-binding Ig-like lectin 14 [Pelobates cultripes]CAH2272599.1 sialic acid-binding Ig-like lectin 14 [Pelobates cultripes]